MKFFILFACFGSIFSQQLGPIIPSNRNFYGYQNSPFQQPQQQQQQNPYMQYQPFPNRQQQQQYAIHPINAQQSWQSQNNFGAQDYMPYRQMQFGQQQQPSTIGMSAASMESISPINSYSNQMPIESPLFPNQNRHAAMSPIQVVYGKPVPMEMQNEQVSQPVASTPSSLPLFLQGAPDDVVDEYKQIIRKPNSNYDEQVKQIDQLVLRLDGEKQKLYKEFMQENDDREQKHRDKIHNNVSEMSEKAQEQFAKISALLRNQALPNEERWGRVLSFYGKLDKNLQNEFEEKFKDFGSK